MTGHRPKPLRLVPPVTLIWDGAADVLQTATDAHAEIDRLARAESPKRHAWYMTLPAVTAQSRARKARRHNRFAVALLMVASVLIGAIFYAASAKADTAADDWATLHGGAVCTTLDRYPTVERVAGILLDVMGDGLAPGQAGKAVRLSVLYGCPDYLPLLRETARRYGTAAVTHV